MLYNRETAWYCPKIYEQIDIKALLQNHSANPPGDAQ
jgi:hypothetical protein